MRRFSASLLLLAVVACQDAPLDPTARADAISDAVHGGGNPHFYLKPPMVPSAAYAGTFDPTLAPTVSICEWNGRTCVGRPIATFSMEAGRGSEVIRMEPGDEQYIVNWHTGKYPVADRKTYRIRYLVADYQLGFADVTFVRGKDARNVNTGEYIPLIDGTTLAIKFRIEEGALPSGAERPIAVGDLHGCGIAQGGAAHCWGANTYGQLGNGTRTSSTSPVAVAGGFAFSQIVTGFSHTCALDTGGAAYCWGYNGIGNLGRGATSLYEATPAPVAGGHTFEQLTAGAHHTCGLKADGSLWCWGYDGAGQLGDGSASFSSTAPAEALGGPYQQVDAGYFSTCGVTTAGEAKCWGFNNVRQLGYSSYWRSPTPTAVDGGHVFSRVQVHSMAGCGVRTDGATLCWGSNAHGTLGQGTVSATLSGPVVVTGGHSFAQVDVGGGHACGVLADGTGYCWGLNSSGQLGTADGVYSTGTPTPVAGSDQWAFLSTGTSTTCGVTTTGAGKCWGLNNSGQAGTGSTSSPLPSPTDITGGLTFEG